MRILQDSCGGENGTFQVLTKSIPCENAESVCSFDITLYLGVCKYEQKLHLQVVFLKR